SRARHREKVRRRWLIGSGIFISLLAASARVYLPEASLFLLAGYGLGVMEDVFVGLRAKARSRIMVDLASVVGAVVLWAGLSAVFSPLMLLLAVGTVLAVLLTIAFAS
ncbi:MAG TPA: serine/threonine protein kinase, partial [Thermopolyspora sp.]